MMLELDVGHGSLARRKATVWDQRTASKDLRIVDRMSETRRADADADV